MRHIKKNDVVVVTTGASAGKSGKVLEVNASAGRAFVEGLNLRKKALRKSQDNPQGGIIEKEASISTANLMLLCPKCKKGVRTRVSRESDQKTRLCRKCGHSFGR